MICLKKIALIDESVIFEDDIKQKSDFVRGYPTETSQIVHDYESSAKNQ